MANKVKKIDAGVAALRVLEDWGVDHIYGLPAGSLNSWMDALEKEKDRIRLIQVRHEEAGALAAAMQAKFSGKIGVVFGSEGPGATHLMNGLYDAREDHVPVLAIIGQRTQKEINLDMFQEMNQNPVFADVSIYNRRVAYAEQLPKIIDEAVRTAIARKGVATVEVPVDFGWAEIDDDSWYSSASAHREYQNPPLDEVDIDAAVEILEKAERPVIYAGIGTRGNGDAVVDLSRKLKAPVAITGINFDNFDHDFEGLLGSAHRVSWKPAVEVFDEADTVLFVGSNYPFAEHTGTFKNTKKFIQIDIDPQKLGKRHKPDAAILGDAGDALRAITAKISEKEETPWYRANLLNIENWREYMHKIETKSEGELEFYQVYNAINNVADDDAIYSIDVGDTTQTSIRHLHLTPKNMWRTSNIFATMGNGLPGAIAAKVDFPDRQVWDIAGDGAFTMNMQDIVTLVKHSLPSIHVVFTNETFGFIRDEQEDTNDNYYGVFIDDIDFAKIAEAQGAVGYTVRNISELKSVYEQAVADEKAGKVVVIDNKISDERPIPNEALELDPYFFSEKEITAFKERYSAQDLVPLSECLESEGLEVRSHQK